MGRKKKYTDEELKEHNRERARRYYVLHRDEMMRRNREWRRANPDRIREYGKRQRIRRNVSQYNSEYYRKNRQRLIELASDWRKANPKRSRATTTSRRSCGELKPKERSWIGQAWKRRLPFSVIRRRQSTSSGLQSV